MLAPVFESAVHAIEAAGRLAAIRLDVSNACALQVSSIRQLAA
jgi:hypothetical protein